MDKRDKKIVFASRDKTMILKPYVMRILKELGHEEAFVTDKSRISDFIEIEATAYEVAEFLKNLANRLGLEAIGDLDYIVDVAYELSEL